MRLIKVLKNWWAWRKIMSEEEVYTVSQSTMEEFKDGGSVDAYTALKLVQGDPETIRRWREKHPAPKKKKGAA